MQTQDIKLVARAIEVMSHGVDISNYTYEDFRKTYFNKDGKIVSRAGDNVPDFLMVFDEAARAYLDGYCSNLLRQGSSYIFKRDIEGLTPNITVNEDMIVSTIQVLYKGGLSSFDGVRREVVDVEFMSRIKDLRENFNRKDNKPSESWLTNMSIDALKKNFEVITAIAYREQPEIRQKMYDTYVNPLKSFNIKGFEDYPIYDNRLFIPVNEADIYDIVKEYPEAEDKLKDMKYLVVSKNLYDYFYCSWGSTFQSCYSIGNSSHNGWFGMIPFGTFDSHFIIYGTKEEPQKVTMQGKWWAPYMHFRSWGWLSEDNELLVDKQYSSSLKQNCLSSLYDKLGFKWDNTYGAYELKEGSKFKKFFDKYILRFYPDSLNRERSKFRFYRDRGDKEFIGSNTYDGSYTVVETLGKISSVSDTFTCTKDIEFSNGNLFNPKRCPFTGVLISEDEDKSFYSKFFKEPIKSLLVLSYCDGYVKTDANSFNGCVNNSAWCCGREVGFSFDGRRIDCSNSPSRFSTIPYNLVKVKEFIKAHIEEAPVNCVLLKVIDNNGVQFIKYRKKVIA